MDFLIVILSVSFVILSVSFVILSVHVVILSVSEESLSERSFTSFRMTEKVQDDSKGSG